MLDEERIDSLNDFHIGSDSSELGQGLLRVLLDPKNPHSHAVGYTEKLHGVLNGLSHLRLGEEMEGASSFFKNARYVFKEESHLPTVVMKSLAEIEEEQNDSRRLKYRARCSEDLVLAIKEGLKKSKKKESLKSEPSAQLPLAVDDDLDIFGGISVQQIPREREHAGNLFAQSVYEDRDVEETNRRIQMALRMREESRVKQDQPGPQSIQEEYFPERTEFGQKLDASKFVDKDSSNVSKKRKNDKQIYSQVMKKIEKL
jgi:hypothetical protein